MRNDGPGDASRPFASTADSDIIWAFRFPGGLACEGLPGDEARPGADLVWLHLNLADHAAHARLAAMVDLPADVRDMLLSSDTHQRALVDGGAVCCVLHDVQRDFGTPYTDRLGALRVVLTERMILTARLHPVGSADIIRRRLTMGARVESAAAGLDLLLGAIIENLDTRIRQIGEDVQAAEDAYLAEHQLPANRQLLGIRRRLARLHRLLDGMQRVFLRLEDDHDLPVALHPTTEKLSQRIQGLDSDVLGLQSQLLLLRDEVEMLNNQRINQNLYTLSVMTALMLPTTLVTGLFGMNTGDLPFTGHGGTLLAGVVAAASALATYLFLRLRGFFR